MAGEKQRKKRKRPVSISALRSGVWLAGDELRATALQAAHATTDVTLDLAQVDHLDASALEILLALDQDRREKGLCLHLVNASPLLRQWFEHTGALSKFSPKLPQQP